MDKKIYIANWKSHKNTEETIKFFDVLKSRLKDIGSNENEIVIAPPFTQLSRCRELIEKNNLNIRLAGQNVSPFPEGAYTGEINAKQVKESADYVIIGHSERKKYFHEKDNDLENKIRESMEVGLTVIQCVQDENDVVHKGAKIIAYEPPSAIGSGNPDDPQHVSSVFKMIIEQNAEIRVLYGGSINKDNVKEFLEIENLSGFLVGGASLDAESFISLFS